MRIQNWQALMGSTVEWKPDLALTCEWHVESRILAVNEGQPTLVQEVVQLLVRVNRNCGLCSFIFFVGVLPPPGIVMWAEQFAASCVHVYQYPTQWSVYGQNTYFNAQIQN